MANNYTDSSIFDGSTWGENTQYLNYSGLQYLFYEKLKPSMEYDPAEVEELRALLEYTNEVLEEVNGASS